MHVVVIGAGAIGSALALGLARDGSDVSLVARGNRLAWLRDHPIELERGGAVLQARVPVSDWAGLARPADAAFLCTKTGDLGEALAELAPRLAPGGTAVMLQNGVEAHEWAAEALPGARITTGRIHGFFEMAGQAVRHVGVAPAVLIGGEAEAARAAAALLTAGGFPAEVTPDILSALWEKMMLTAALGAVGAAMGFNAGQVCAAPGGEELLRAAMDEVARVGTACGARLGPAEVERMMGFVRAFPEDATTSLQRDLAVGTRSEYDALVGAVLRGASRHGVAVPTFAGLDRQLRSGSAD